MGAMNQDTGASKKSRRWICFVLTFVMPLDFFLSTYHSFTQMTLGLEPKAIDNLAILGSVILVIFCFSYAYYAIPSYAHYYIPSELPFLQRSLAYLGWWSFLLLVKHLIVLVPGATVPIVLTSLIHLLGLYLVILMLINLRRLLSQAGPPRTEPVQT